MPAFDLAPPSVFTAFARSVERLATEQAGRDGEDLGRLHAVLGGALARASSQLPARDADDATARQHADAALALLREAR